MFDYLATLECTLLGNRQPENMDINERLNNLEKKQKRLLRYIGLPGNANEIPDRGWSGTTPANTRQRILDLRLNHLTFGVTDQELDNDFIDGGATHSHTRR